MRNSHIVGEEWRHVEGTDGRYQVSNMGRVIGPRSINPLKPTKSRNGRYLQIEICIKGKASKRLVHHVVLEAFHGQRNGRICRHLNGNPTDNRAVNLRWGTQKENYADCVAHGRNPYGGRNGNCTKTEHQVCETVRLSRLGLTSDEVAKLVGIKSKEVSHIMRGKSWGWLTGIKKNRGTRKPRAGKEVGI